MLPGAVISTSLFHQPDRTVADIDGDCSQAFAATWPAKTGARVHFKACAVCGTSQHATTQQKLARRPIETATRMRTHVAKRRYVIARSGQQDVRSGKHPNGVESQDTLIRDICKVAQALFMTMLHPASAST